MKKKKILVIATLVSLVFVLSYHTFQTTSFNRAIRYALTAHNWQRVIQDDIIVLRTGNFGRFNVEYKLVFGEIIPEEDESTSNDFKYDETQIYTRYYDSFPFLVYMERNQWGIWEPVLWEIDYWGFGINFQFIIFPASSDIVTYNNVVIPSTEFTRLNLEMLPDDISVQILENGNKRFWDVGEDTHHHLFDMTMEEHNEQPIIFIESSVHHEFGRHPNLLWELFFD